MIQSFTSKHTTKPFSFSEDNKIYFFFKPLYGEKNYHREIVSQGRQKLTYNVASCC